MLILAHMACSKDSGDPTTTPAFTVQTGFWSTNINFKEEAPINSVFFRVSDDGSALHDFVATCRDAAGSYGMNPIGTIPISGTTFNMTISGDDTKITIVKRPYDIQLSGRFSSPEKAVVTIEWGDAYNCTQQVEQNDTCVYATGDASFSVSCTGDAE